jgi:hypothetical protein
MRRASKRSSEKERAYRPRRHPPTRIPNTLLVALGRGQGPFRLEASGLVRGERRRRRDESSEHVQIREPLAKRGWRVAIRVSVLRRAIPERSTHTSSCKTYMVGLVPGVFKMHSARTSGGLVWRRVPGWCMREALAGERHEPALEACENVVFSRNKIKCPKVRRWSAEVACANTIWVSYKIVVIRFGRYRIAPSQASSDQSLVCAASR